MRTNDESITADAAMTRGLEFGWNKVFESASHGSLDKLAMNSPGMEALGQGLHALQDAYAHRGASWKEHSVRRDLYGIGSDVASSITMSALIVHEILSGNFSHVSGGMSLNLTGLSRERVEQIINTLKDQGYQVNVNYVR